MVPEEEAGIGDVHRDAVEDAGGADDRGGIDGRELGAGEGQSKDVERLLVRGRVAAVLSKRSASCRWVDLREIRSSSRRISLGGSACETKGGESSWLRPC